MTPELGAAIVAVAVFVVAIGAVARFVEWLAR